MKLNGFGHSKEKILPVIIVLVLIDLLHWIVTSDITGSTYRNIYCAVCHRESVNNMQFWSVDLECPTFRESTTESVLPTDLSDVPISDSELLDFYNR